MKSSGCAAEDEENGLHEQIFEIVEKALVQIDSEGKTARLMKSFRISWLKSRTTNLLSYGMNFERFISSLRKRIASYAFEELA
jgi:hypothetical protein